MNIAELIEALEEIAEEYPDAEVLLATQPSYPLAFTIERAHADMDGVVWIAQGEPAADPYAVTEGVWGN